MGFTENSRRDIEDYLKKNLKEMRLQHTYAVAEEAEKLARRYGEDMERARLAALFHDMFRGVSPAALNLYIKHLGLPERYKDNPNLAHGKIAARIMERDYGITDRDVINAVAYHTTGRAGMSKLEKILFLADAIEPGRCYPTVEETRAIAYEDLDRACISSLERTIEYIRGRGDYLDPDTIEARDDLKEKLNL
ncbi:MAG: bis(5'-nucleosyl)-tetraphosphatase (symmetrical) YqeK [Bacillota bacterium]|nr:bis(5'-nucleosyl)-tetraphosphatase (symmetrical) YqeK [Bacillota bacterium]